MRKKLISILLVLVLCFSLLPTIALADENTGAIETQISAVYKNLYYSENYEKPGEITAGGTVEITVTTNSSPATPVTEGKVVVYWTDDNNNTIPFSTMEMPLNTTNGGVVKVWPGGIPVQFLGNGHISYTPPEDSTTYQPSSGTVDTSSLRNLSISSDVKLSVNYASITTFPAILPVLPNTDITIDLPFDAEGTYQISLDGSTPEVKDTIDGKSIAFTMPDSNKSIAVDWIVCTTHANSNKDHLCDVCGESSDSCVDSNNNHKCDVCDEVLSTCAEGTKVDHKCDVCGKGLDICSEGETVDHKCDICKKIFSNLCTDISPSDHICDNAACKRQMSELCADVDPGDHYCDNTGCKRTLSDCNSSDSNKDDICDICNALLYRLEVKGISVNDGNKDNILGDAAASVKYDPATKTLTLNNADIHTTGHYGIRSKLSQSSKLTIKLIGENRVAADGVYGLRSTANVDICGSGSLDISAGDIAIYLDGAGREYGTLTVCENAEVNAAGGVVKSGSGFGVKAEDCLTVRDSAKLTASSISAPDRSSGIYVVDVVTVQDNAELVVTGGDLNGKAGTDSYGIRTTHIYVHGGTLTANGGDAADSIGIYTQTFDMTGGKVYAYGANSVHGPSYGLRSNKYLNISGGSIVAIGGNAPNDQSCGIMVNNTSSDSMADDGGTLTVTGGKIYAVAKDGAFSHGIKANHIAVSNGIIIAESAKAETNEGDMTISSGITAENTFTVTGGHITSKSSSADTYSYGIQAVSMNVSGGNIKADSGSAQGSYGLWSFNEMSVSNKGTVVRASSENGYAVYSANGIDIQSPLTVITPTAGIVTSTSGQTGTFYFVSHYNKTPARSVVISYPTPIVTPASTETNNGVVSGSSYSAYSDLGNEAWYRDAVTFVLEKGLMNGVGNGKFDPNGEVNRAMIVTMLWRLEGKPVSTQIGSGAFTDVPENLWYTDAVKWAAANGIVEGYNGKFSPNESITREQLAAILYRYEQYKGGGFKGTWMFLLDYADRSDVSDWAYESLCWMNMNEVINGRPGKVIVPKDNSSRAEAAAMFHRYCEVMSSK